MHWGRMSKHFAHAWLDMNHYIQVSCRRTTKSEHFRTRSKRLQQRRLTLLLHILQTWQATRATRSCAGKFVLKCAHHSGHVQMVALVVDACIVDQGVTVQA